MTYFTVRDVVNRVRVLYGGVFRERTRRNDACWVTQRPGLSLGVPVTRIGNSCPLAFYPTSNSVLWCWRDVHLLWTRAYRDVYLSDCGHRAIRVSVAVLTYPCNPSSAVRGSISAVPLTLRVQCLVLQNNCRPCSMSKIIETRMMLDWSGHRYMFWRFTYKLKSVNMRNVLLMLSRNFPLTN